MDHRQKLKAALLNHGVLKAPGVFNGLSLKLAEQANFELAFVSGAGIAFASYGIADIGLIDCREVARHINVMREYNELPLIVDIDTGFGNALNVQRTARLFEQSGATAMQMEDQLMPKRCGHMTGKQVVSAAEMVGKIHAFVDAREHNDTLLIARTDALGVNGFEDAMERARLYFEAGADLLFIEAPKNLEQMQIIGQEFGDKVPLIHNLVEGGDSPVSNADDLSQLKYKIALYPVALIHNFIPNAQSLLNHIHATGNTNKFNGKLIDLNQINTLLNADGMLEAAKNYDV